MEGFNYKIVFLPLIFSILFSFELHTGDIILRKQPNFVSDMFAKIDSCGYSHGGIIVKDAGKTFVAHIEYSKGKDFKIVPFERFVENSSYKIIRPKYKIDSKKLLNEIYKIKRQNPEFDFKFSLKNRALYCTEFIERVYFELFKKHVYAYLYPFRGKKIITIKSILKNPDFKAVCVKENLK